MMKVFVLMTQWKDGNPEVAGVFSSFDKAAACFVNENFNNTTRSTAQMQLESVRVALKLAHKTNDEDFTDFGNMRAWIERYEVDGCYAVWEEAKK